MGALAPLLVLEPRDWADAEAARSLVTALSEIDGRCLRLEEGAALPLTLGPGLTVLCDGAPGRQVRERVRARGARLVVVLAVGVTPGPDLAEAPRLAYGHADPGSNLALARALGVEPAGGWSEALAPLENILVGPSRSASPAGPGARVPSLAGAYLAGRLLSLRHTLPNSLYYPLARIMGRDGWVA